MTDRLERRLPEVLAELSLPRLPDYVDDLLSRTARMPQRPGWTLLERWFPVSTLTSLVPAARRPALRPLITIAVILALLAASIAWYVGSQRHLPPLYGPARNGLVISTNRHGDLVAIDPTTNASKSLVSGPDVCCANVSPDGQRVAFLRVPVGTDGEPTALGIVNIDGSGLLELPADVVNRVTWLEWSPTGDRLLISTPTDPSILDVPSGAVTHITPPVSAPDEVIRASWVGISGDIVLTSKVSDHVYWVHRYAAGETSKGTLVADLAFAVDPPLVSPDGSRLLYFIWGADDSSHGRLHVLELSTGLDREVSPPEAAGAPHTSEWEGPVWSPDGRSIAVEVYTTAENHLAIIPAGGGDATFIGPAFPEMTGGVIKQFSPDGQSVLARYRFDSSTWLLPISGAEGRKLAWDASEDFGWQRLAP